MFKEMQDEYFEFISQLKILAELARAENINVPQVLDVYGQVI
jgi:hypothetical protein